MYTNYKGYIMPYIKPAVQRVRLKSDQAVLQTCVVSGVYVSTMAGRCVGAGATGAYTIACPEQIKLRSTKMGTTESTSTSALPS